ncbi:Acetyl-CoA hydrolase/transferase [Trinorchestia longiramus]|nr:Acetyl-CoA hydrolase/transferase [Trinorchestia longiramus]
MNFHHTRSFYNKSSAVSGLLNLSTVQNSSTVQNFSTVQNSSTVQNACTVQSTAGRRAYYTYSHEPFHPLKRVPKWQTADEAVAVVKSGDTVFIHGAAATPLLLVEAMTKHGLDNALQNVTVCHIHTEGDAAYAKPECEGIFRSSSFFIGANCRKAVNEGRGDYTPIFLSDIPLLFHRHIITIDVALVQVSPPDKHGFCSLGTSVDCARAAIQNAKYIIGQVSVPSGRSVYHQAGQCTIRQVSVPSGRSVYHQAGQCTIRQVSVPTGRSVYHQAGQCTIRQVNPCMPRTFGDGVVHKSHFDAMVDGLAPLPEHVPKQRSQVEDTIGRLIAENLVVDGATLQMGIGNIPDAVLASLTGHKNLGIHSEMFSDGVVELVEAGCVTNTYKDMHPGKITGSFLVGTRKLFDFVDNNPFVGEAKGLEILSLVT